MFDALKNLAGGAAGGSLDPQALEQAAAQHLQGTSADEVSGNLQTAASNLQQQGQGDLAQQVMGLVSKLQSDPSGAKDDVVALIKANPQIIQHFAPEFAQGILGKMGL